MLAMAKTNPSPPLLRSLKIQDETASMVPAVTTISPTEMPRPTLPQLDRLHQAIETSGIPRLDLAAHTAHHFCRGMYARELRVPAGYVVVGKMHASENFFLLVSGECSISTNDGIRRLRGPVLAVTKPGDKRVCFAHTDVVMFNFHTRTDEAEDIKVLEARYVVPREEEHRALEWLADANRKTLEGIR